MTRKNITLSDIAKSVGVSTATVSLAINNDSRVAVKTRRKILEKIEELDYIYNRGAAGLKTGQSNTVGLAVHDITNPYFTEVSAEAEACLSQNGKMAFHCNTSESLEQQERFIETLIEYGAEGLIMSPAVGTDLKSLRPIISRGLPTVMIGRYIDGANLDFVGTDGTLLFERLTKHLIKLGHTRIAMVGGGELTTVDHTRRLGFFSAMEKHGMLVDPSLVINCPTSRQGGQESIHFILSLKPQPTAVICFSDLIAIGVLSGLYRKGLQPGKDIAVVGCDDIEEASTGYVQLTTIKINKAEIGRKAAELLIRRINTPHASHRHILVKSELIVRESCGSYFNEVSMNQEV